MLAATLAFSLSFPQIHVEPYRAEVGQQVELHVAREGQALAGAEVTAELPDGTKAAVGSSAVDGRLSFVPTLVGQYVFRTAVDGLVMVAPCQVGPAPLRWVAAMVCVPPGLALLWVLLWTTRSRGARSRESQQAPALDPGRALSPERDRRAP